MKVISYSLFGYNKERQENCFDFNSYLRGLWINVRLAKVLYPDWEVMVHVDNETFHGLKPMFVEMSNYNVTFRTEPSSPLCEAMLWRMKPIWYEGVTHTICRDLDSPLTYREAQMVNEWIESGKRVHAITDSVSHNIPMMGGMVGFTHYVKENISSWHELINGEDLRVKGTDQDVLNRKVYPLFAQHGNDSILQHYILGMPNTFLSGFRNTYNDTSLKGVREEYRQTNDLCGHIGAAGYYEPPMIKFLNGYDHNKENYREFENKYKNIFFWAQ